jgi:transglutaminase-like putative cysteine protease
MAVKRAPVNRALLVALLVAASGSVFAAAPATPATPAPGASAGEDAVLLEERLEIALTSPTSARVRYFNRTQVLTPRGAESYRTAVIEHGPGVTIREARGAVITPEGRRLEVRRQQIADAAAFADYALYADSMVRALTFIGLVPGATLEYSYEQELGNLFYLPRRFDLQEEIPARLKTLSLTAPAASMPRVAVVGAQPEYTHEERDGLVTQRWTVRDVGGIRQEPNLPPLADIVPHIGLYPRRIAWSGYDVDAADWAGIGRFYWTLARDRLSPSPEVAAEARRLSAGRPTPEEKTRALFEFVQGRINYVEISLDIGGYQPHANGDVLKYRYGDCKDKATLLIAMLRAVDLDALPVLIRTRDAGLLDRDNPGLVFNHAIVAIPGPDGYLFLDPTDTVTPYGDLPWMDQGVSVVIVKPDGSGELGETPLLAPERNRRQRTVTAAINDAGDLEGTYDIAAWGQERVSMAGFLDTGETRRQDLMEDVIASLCPGAVLKGYEVKPPASPSDPVRLSIRFAVPRFVTRSGGLEIVAPQMVRLGWLTRIGSAPARRNAVLLPYLSLQSSLIRITLPPGRTLRKVPESRDRTGAGLAATTRYALLSENGRAVLEVRREVKVASREIAPSDYPALQAVLRGLAEDEAAAVTLIPSS